MFLPALLNDGDTLWQIRTGQWILAHHAIPATDPFSFTAGDRRWFPHEWLAETLMALAYQAAGMRGIMVLAAGALGVTAGLIAGHQVVLRDAASRRAELALLRAMGMSSRVMLVYLASEHLYVLLAGLLVL